RRWHQAIRERRWCSWLPGLSAVAAFECVALGALAGGGAGLADILGVAAGRAGDKFSGHEVSDGGVPVVADAVSAAPVPGGGGVGVVAADDGVAALTAAHDVDAAGLTVLDGVEVFVSDDGFDVVENGDGHDRVSFCDW